MSNALPDFVIKAGERKAHPYHMWEAVKSIPEVLKNTLLAYEKSPYTVAGETIANKNFVYFTGCGTSYYDGIAGRYIFRELAKVNGFAEYALEFLNYPPIYSKDDVCVGISHTGGTAAVLNAIEKFKTAGGYTVGITDVEDSALAKTADFILSGAAGREPSLPKSRSYVAALLKLFLLAADIADAKKIDTKLFRENIKKVPELSADMLSKNEQLVKDIAANKYEKIYIFGSGINLSTINEGALKLNEAVQIVAVPLELEEGMHGPWVTMNKGDLVIVLNIGDKNRDKNQKLMRALSHINVDILDITDDNNSSEAFGKYTINISAPEEFSVFYTVLPIYQLTYFLALNKGQSPDFMRLWEENYLKTRLSLPR